MGDPRAVFLTKPGRIIFAISLACCLGLKTFADGTSQPKSAGQSPKVTAERADAFLVKHRQASAGNSAAMQFSMAFHGQSNRFHPGERIRLDLRHDGPASVAYSSEASFLYVLDHYDGVQSPRIGEWQTGRLPDPFSGGVTTNQVRALTVDLNNVFRFTAPGHYRMFAYSLANIAGPMEPPVSNILEFDILPRDAAWEAATARDTEDAAVLRYLGTNDAALRLAKALDVDALYCVRDRAFALRAIERELESREIPDSGLFVRQLAELAVLARHPEGAPYPLDEYPRFVARYSARRARALSKTPGRLEDALKTEVVEAAQTDSFARGGSLIAALDQFPTEAATVFRGLPAKAQRNLLLGSWGWLNKPALRPLLIDTVTAPAEDDPEVRNLALRRLYESAPSVARPLILAELRRSPVRLSAEVLGLLPERTLRWLDRSLIRELRTVAGPVDPHAQRNDQYWPFRWHDEPDTNLARVIQRYATPAAAEDIVAVYRARKSTLSCGARSALLAYLQTATPATAVTLIEQAVVEQSETGCWYVLEEVAEFGFSPEVERRVIRYLDEPGEWLVQSAARALARGGSAGAKAPLLRRFAAWNSEWKPRRLEFEQGGEAIRRQWDIESALSRALDEGSAWYVERDTIHGLCVTAACEAEFGSRTPTLRDKIYAGAADRMRRDHDIAIVPPDNLLVQGWRLAVGCSYGLTIDRAKAWLQQYPRGTVFWWDMSFGIADEVLPVATRERVRGELNTFLQRHGMWLKVYRGVKPQAERPFGWWPTGVR
jgi:hypothetical protein